MLRNVFIAVLAPALLGAQGVSKPDTQQWYVIRGEVTKLHQGDLTARVGRFHAGLRDTLKRWAPDLLPRLEDPPSIATGYQLLPRITPSEPQPVTKPSQLVSYSWRWSETLIATETSALEKLQTDLAASAGRRGALELLVTGYRGLIGRKRLIDADVNYNWLWQGEITRVRSAFDKNQALIDALLRQRTTQPDAQRVADSALVANGLAADVHQVDPPAFVSIQQRGSQVYIDVPVVTDIQDTAFIRAFSGIVTNSWWAKSSAGIEYSLSVTVRTISPFELYCGNSAPTSCAPPAKGAAINMTDHLARFPKDAAILTTGALSSHFEGGRAIVLSPHDAPRHLIVHEFGHVLGFRDAYIRGYRDAGKDGFVVTELVVDNSDVMGNSRDGSVKASHFERLRARLTNRP